jgi:FAD/FMN-containing dehydrogenase
MAPLQILAAPAHFFWDAAFLKQNLPQVVIADNRPGAPDDAVFWAGNLGEAGWYIHNYESVWMPRALLVDGNDRRLVEAMFAASRHRAFELHFNKGLAGAPADALAASRDTPMNPAVLDAFALAISAAGGPPAFAGIARHEPDAARATREATAVSACLAELARLAPGAPTYVAESSYFQKDWQRAYWGDNYARLKSVKKQYDPDGLFFAHHCPGSEEWSADGFTRL